MTYVFDDVTYVYDDVTYVYDDVTYENDDVTCVSHWARRTSCLCIVTSPHVLFVHSHVPLRPVCA